MSLRHTAFLLLLLCAHVAAASSLYDLPVAFTDDHGRTVRLADWRGRDTLITMEYANCRFVCSITLQRLKDVQAAADRSGRRIDFLIISLDPKNDTPAEWTRYRTTRDLDRPNWHFLTASVADTPGVARQLGINYWMYLEHIMHDFRLLRVDAAGAVVKTMETYDANADDFVR
jgi:protein SCO1/2